MKTIQVMPAEEIKIQFTDGKEYTASFNMLAVAHMQQAMMSENTDSVSVLEFGALVLYGTIRANDDTFTLDEAKALALAMRPTDLNGIIQTYTESMGAADNSAVKEAQKKVIAQMLLKMSRLK